MMGASAYIWAAIAIAIIWGIRGIIRWYNLPKVAEARAKKVLARQTERTKRVLIRRGHANPTPEQIEHEMEKEKSRPGLFKRWRRK